MTTPAQRVAAWFRFLPMADQMLITSSVLILADAKVRNPGRFDLHEDELLVAATPEESRAYALDGANRYRGEPDDLEARRVVDLCDAIAAKLARCFGLS